MSNNITEVKSGGIGFFGLLAILFIGLKLSGVINWSWWWVTAPLWGGVALVGGICLAVVAVAILHTLAYDVVWKAWKARKAKKLQAAED